MRNVFRNGCALAGWSAFTLVALAAGVYAVLEHYLAAKDALVRLGTDQHPLVNDELLGMIVGAVAPRLTLAAAMAFTIAIGQALGLFLFFKLLLGLVALAQHRRRAVQLQQADEVFAANELLMTTALQLTLLTALLWWAIGFEWHLFVFRSLASAFDLDDTSAAQMSNLPAMMRENGDVFSVGLAATGATGYIAFTGIPALGVEIGMTQASRRFARLGAAIKELVDEADSAADVNSELSNIDEESATTNTAPSPDTVPAAPHEGTEGTVQTGSLDGSADPGHPDDAAKPMPQDRRPVHGTDGMTASLTEAQARPDRYYIDPSTGYIWDRTFWKQLHGESTAADAQEAA